MFKIDYNRIVVNILYNNKKGGTTMSSIKISNITDVNGFLKTVDECKGNIELITSEGDRLNLRSKLCQYVSLTKIFAEAKIDEITIAVSDPDDVGRLLQYLITR